jgi:hypothetical protein
MCGNPGTDRAIAVNDYYAQRRCATTKSAAIWVGVSNQLAATDKSTTDIQQLHTSIDLWKIIRNRQWLYKPFTIGLELKDHQVHQVQQHLRQ